MTIGQCVHDLELIAATGDPTDLAGTNQGPLQSNGMCLLEFVVHWNL